MACMHGLAANCSICSGLGPLKREPFVPRRVEDDEPRLAKMRDKTEWRGIGRSTGELGTLDARMAAVDATPQTPAYVPPPDKTVDELTAEFLADIQAKRAAKTRVVKWGDREITCDVGRSPFVPDKMPRGHSLRMPRLMKHARNPGRSAMASIARKRG